MAKAGDDAYLELTGLMKEWSTLGSCASVLGWDERTYMPPKGSAHRSEQMALLARLGHEQLTSPRIGALCDLLGEQMVDRESAQWANVREIRRLHDRAAKIPKQLIEELARITTRAQQVWQDAKSASNYSSFLPWLQRIVVLKREEAQAVGYDESPYDALLDEFEPGATASFCRELFAQLAAQLTPLIAAIQAAPVRPKAEILRRSYPIDRQESFGRDVAARFGYDFEAGRLDPTAHPFCTGIGPGDCRITTRYHPRRFAEAFFGILHEVGHGLYEQGLDPDHFGTPLGMATSLGVHESQSRLWENLVGRARGFWDFHFPMARAAFPEALADVDVDTFHFAINEVRPSFIRIESDEATYNLHIILRFELEQALLSNDLPAADLPSAWDELFQKFFQLKPKCHGEGCLQDIHWSMGGIGYFPTYTLGNIYASQFMDAARAELGDLDSDFRKGEFTRLRLWLNDRIHRHGHRYRARELCKRITGRDVNAQPLMTYLTAKFGKLYGV